MWCLVSHSHAKIDKSHRTTSRFPSESIPWAYAVLHSDGLSEVSSTTTTQYAVYISTEQTYLHSVSRHTRELKTLHNYTMNSHKCGWSIVSPLVTQRFITLLQLSQAKAQSVPPVNVQMLKPIQTTDAKHRWVSGAGSLCHVEWRRMEKEILPCMIELLVAADRTIRKLNFRHKTLTAQSSHSTHYY